MRIPFLSARDRRPVLVVLHHERSCPGHIGTALHRRGHILDVRRPRYGDPLPSTLDGHAGVVVMGGTMSATDRDDWIRREIEWLSVPLREGRPLLGVCLGAQMLATHLGARVARHPRGLVQVGHYRIEMTDAGRELLGTPPFSRVLQWHKESFNVPQGSRLLAYDEHGVQAFAHGPAALGVQFHPEATMAHVRRWVSENAVAAEAPGARTIGSMIPTHLECDAKAERWVHGLVGGWLSRDAGLAPSRRGTLARPSHVAEAVAV